MVRIALSTTNLRSYLRLFYVHAHMYTTRRSRKLSSVTRGLYPGCSAFRKIMLVNCNMGNVRISTKEVSMQEVSDASYYFVNFQS